MPTIVNSPGIMTTLPAWLQPPETLPEPVSPTYVRPVDVPGTSLQDTVLGCGILAPFQRDGKGDFRNGCGVLAVQSSVDRILGVVSMSNTTHGDTEWRPEFGSLIDHIRHAPATEATAELCRYYVIDALRIWEPRINVHQASVQFVDRNDPGSSPGVACEIHLLYDILAQNRGAGVLFAGVNQLVTLNTGVAQAV